MRFSIIIPVYNVEKYICQCVDSVLEQNYSDYEILLIDDGSNDNSPEICDEYVNNNHEIYVFHKTNGGLSSARNFGLDHCRGEYIVFLDSDDWIKPGSLERINECIGTCCPDVIISTMCEVYDDREEYRDKAFDEYISSKGLKKDEALQWMVKETENKWPAPKYILSRKFVEKNKLRFLNGRLHEDMDWTSRVCYLAETFAGFTEPWYCHRMGREGSITNSVNPKEIVDVIEMAAVHYEEYKNNPSQLRESVMVNIMHSVYAKINLIKYCDKKGIASVSKAIEKNWRIFSITPKMKYWLFVKCMKVFGVEQSLYLLSARKW